MEKLARLVAALLVAVYWSPRTHRSFNRTLRIVVPWRPAATWTYRPHALQPALAADANDHACGDGVANFVVSTHRSVPSRRNTGAGGRNSPLR